MTGAVRGIQHTHAYTVPTFRLKYELDSNFPVKTILSNFRMDKRPSFIATNHRPGILN